MVAFTGFSGTDSLSDPVFFSVIHFPFSKEAIAPFETLWDNPIIQAAAFYQQEDAALYHYLLSYFLS